MNDNDSTKLRGGTPTASKLWGQDASTAPPPPGSRITVFARWLYACIGKRATTRRRCDT